MRHYIIKVFLLKYNYNREGTGVTFFISISYIVIQFKKKSDHNNSAGSNKLCDLLKSESEKVFVFGALRKGEIVKKWQKHMIIYLNCF